MKRKIVVLYIMLFMLLAVGCAKEETPPVNENQNNQENQAVAADQLPGFEAADLFDNAVTNEIFTDYSVTMINIWGTFCNPCVREMPDLAQLHNDIETMDANLIGILVDVSEEQNKELAIEIVQENGVEFTNIIPDEALIDYLSNKIAAVPTTIFVDNQGHIIGEPVVGAKGKDEYKEEIQKRLKEVE